MTLANFKTYVKLDFKRTDKDTEIIQAYNDSIIAVAAKLPNSKYKYTSYVPTVAQQPDYPIPSLSMYIFHPIKLLEGSAASDSGWILEHITKDEYDRLEPNPFRTSPDTTGDPIKYTIASGLILPYPIPDDATHLIEIDWTTVPTDQSADSDTPALPDYWRETLKAMTLDRLYAGLGLYQESGFWHSKYEDKKGNPVGLYKDFLDIEKSVELNAIGRIVNNDL